MRKHSRQTEVIRTACLVGIVSVLTALLVWSWVSSVGHDESEHAREIMEQTK